MFRRLWFLHKRSIRGQGYDRCKRCRVPSGRCGRQIGVRCWHEDGQKSGGDQPTDCAEREQGSNEPRAPATTSPPVTLASARPAPVDSILLYSCQSLPFGLVTHIRAKIRYDTVVPQRQSSSDVKTFPFQLGKRWRRHYRYKNIENLGLHYAVKVGLNKPSHCRGRFYKAQSVGLLFKSCSDQQK